MIALISVLVVSLASGFASRQNQDKKPYWEHEVATPVIEGGLTAQQKEHSKLYEEAYKRDRKIGDLLLETKEGVTVHRIPGITIVYPRGAPTPDPITEVSERADAVVIANVVSKSSQITNDGTYVFTDYEMRVEEVLKNVGAGRLKAEDSITVTRPGGKVLLHGQIALFTDASFKSLFQGRRYLLFLCYLPSTGTYRSVSHAGSFDISGSRVETLSEESTAQYFEKDLGAFIPRVKLAIANSLNH